MTKTALLVLPAPLTVRHKTNLRARKGKQGKAGGNRAFSVLKAMVFHRPGNQASILGYQWVEMWI
jgi:hypothetical protein